MRLIIATLLLLTTPALADDAKFYTGGAEASLTWLNADSVHVIGLREAPDTVCRIVDRSGVAALFDCDGTDVAAYFRGREAIVFGSELFELYKN